MDLEIKRLLDEFDKNDRVILELIKYNLDDIAKVALQEKMYDVFVKLFKPIEIDGVVKIYYDYFSWVSFMLVDIYKSCSVSDEDKEYILNQIYSLDMDMIRRIKIGDSRARQISGWGHPVNDERDVIYYAEPACIEAMLSLFRMNIVTTMNDVECCKDDNGIQDKGKSVIWINYELLDDNNRRIIDDYISMGTAEFVEREMVRTVSIMVPCRSSETVGEVSDRFMELVSKLSIQDVKYDVFNDEVLRNKAISIMEVRFKWRLINLEYEELSKYVLKYLSEFDKEEYPEIDEVVRCVKEKGYTLYQLNEYVFSQADLLYLVASGLVDKMSKEEMTEMVLESFYLDVSSGLLFEGEVAYKKHQNYLNVVASKKNADGFGTK